MSALRALSLIAAAVVAANASAHHGIANFDFNKDVAITGTRGKAHVRQPALVAVRERGRAERRSPPSGVARCVRRRSCAARVGARSVHRGVASERHGRARPQRAEHLLSRHDHVCRRHEHGPLRATAEGGAHGRGRQSARAARERRSEHQRRLGRRATRHDGPERHQRRARADQRGRHAGAGRRARRRARVPGLARHARGGSRTTRFARRGRGRAPCR